MTKKQSIDKPLPDYLLPLLLLLAPLLFYPGLRDFANLPKTAFIQVIVSVSWIIWLLRRLHRGAIEIIKHPLLLVMGLWLTWCGASIFWSVDTFSAISLWLHWLLCGLCFFLVVHTVKSFKQIDKLALFCVIGANIAAIIGIIQYLWGMELIPQTARPAASFAHRNAAAQFIVFTLPFAMMLFFSRQNKKRIPLYAALLTVPLVFLYYCKTRAAWLALFLSLLLLMVFITATKSRNIFKTNQGKSKITALLLSLVVIILMVNIPAHEYKPPPGKKRAYETGQVGPGPREMSFKEAWGSMLDYGKGTAQTRIAMWRNSFDMSMDHFPLGVGLDNWYIYYPLYYNSSQKDSAFTLDHQPVKLHNTPLQILAETSIIGLCLYLAIFYILIRRFLKTYAASKDPGLNIRLLFIMTAVCVFFINSLFTFPMRMAMPPLLLMVSAGLLVSMEALGGQEHRSFVLCRSRKKITLLIGCSFLGILFLIFFNARRIEGDRHLANSIRFNGAGLWQQAKQAGHSAKNLLPHHRVWLELARANNGLGLYEEAIEAGLQALRLHPNYANTYLRLAYIHLTRGDPSQAQHYIKTALDILPKSEDAHYLMGLVKEKLSLPSEAETHYKRVIDLNKTHAGAFLRLGIIRFQAQEPDKAQKYLQNSLALESNLAGAHFYLGLIFEKQNLPEQAIQAYSKETAHNPRNAEAHINLGILYARQQEWLKAIKLYQKAIIIKPSSGAAYVNLAFAYYKLKDYPSARKHAEIGKKLGVPQADMILELLKTNKKK
jgi:tetratricopeptide (TPR) repeat protein/O-antigen ligase